MSTSTRALYLAGKEISKKGGGAGLIFPGTAIAFPLILLAARRLTKPDDLSSA